MALHLTSVLGLTVALATVLLLIVGLGRLARRFGLNALARGGHQSRLSVAASVAIDPKRRLIIISCDDREGLLLLGPHGDLMLGWIDRRHGAPS